MPSNYEKRRYAALTTKGQGWWIVYVGEPGQAQEEVREKALDTLWKENGYDVAKENLAIMTVSACKRAFPQAWKYWEYAQSVGKN